MENKKLSVGKMIGYSIGSIGDYAVYGFIFSFLSYFLTTVAGVSPAVSGTIIFIALIWDGVTDPICGILMDRSKCKYGKRRPMILGSLPVMGASIILLFINVDLPSIQQNIYYCILVCVFWTSYTVFNIPYYSMGAIITLNDSERTVTSAIRQVIAPVGNLCASSLPTVVVAIVMAQGFEEDSAWFAAAVAVAVISVISILIMWRTTRGMEPIEEELAQLAEKQHSWKESLADIIAIMKYKPYILIILAALFMNVQMTFSNSSTMYYCIYIAGLSEMQIAGLFTIGTVAGVIMAPIMAYFAVNFDKKKVYFWCMLSSGVVLFIMYFVVPVTQLSIIVFRLLSGFGNGAYWLFIFNLLYDVADADEMLTKKRKDGVIMSYYSFLLKVGGAVASLAFGYMLEFAGFDGEAMTQSTEALGSILSVHALLPGIFYILSAFMILMTPLSKKKMAEMREEYSFHAEG